MTDNTTVVDERDDQAEARWAARLKAAEAAVVEAQAAETEAFAAVDRARAERGLGLASASVVIKAQRRLAAAQEASATAEAVVRRAVHDTQQERDQRDRARTAAARAERQAYAGQRAASLIRARELFGLITGALEAINDLPSVPTLRTYRGDWERLQDALNRLQSRY